MRYSSVSAIGAFTDVNTHTGDYLLLDPARCSGGRAATMRTNIENLPGGDGVLAFPPLKGAQIITLSGPIVITSTDIEADFFTAIDTVLDNLESALEAMRLAPDNIVHSAGTITCWTYANLEQTWENGLQIATFSLVSN